LLFEAIKFTDKGFELLRVAFLLRIVELFMQFADFAVGFQLVLVADDFLNELLSILDSRLRSRKCNDRYGDEERSGHKELECREKIIMSPPPLSALCAANEVAVAIEAGLRVKSLLNSEGLERSKSATAVECLASSNSRETF
jgi:hypothetical protein